MFQPKFLHFNPYFPGTLIATRDSAEGKCGVLFAISILIFLERSLQPTFQTALETSWHINFNPYFPGTLIATQKASAYLLWASQVISILIFLERSLQRGGARGAWAAEGDISILIFLERSLQQTLERLRQQTESNFNPYFPGTLIATWLQNI